jgi:trigger factor
MQVQNEQIEATKRQLTVTADRPLLDQTKQTVLKQLGREIKVPGFRPGKAPTHLIEKQLDQRQLQAEFLEQAVNQLYAAAVTQEQLRPVAQPQITITKFVPFTALEFTAEVEVIGDIELADYKKVRLAPKPVNVIAKDVDEVLSDLRRRAAARTDVTRAAQNGDEVTIDFEGTDAKTGKLIEGAEGKGHPLLLGSQAFIPGFEDKLVGLKAGAEKTFPLTFPADYAVKALQKRQVKFRIKVAKVQALSEPKLDDAFAASVGPFKTLAELKADIKKQLTAEKQRQAQSAYDDELLTKLIELSTVTVPPALVEAEIDHMEEEEKRNLAYRGQTWQEHLAAEGLTAEAHREQKRTAAKRRIKAGLILGEVAEGEHITVTPEELEVRVQLLKGQYTDPAMQAELDKPENRGDIRGRLLTEKTLDVLRGYATK